MEVPLYIHTPQSGVQFRKAITQDRLITAIMKIVTRISTT